MNESSLEAFSRSDVQLDDVRWV